MEQTYLYITGGQICHRKTEREERRQGHENKCPKILSGARFSFYLLAHVAKSQSVEKCVLTCTIVGLALLLLAYVRRNLLKMVAKKYVTSSLSTNADIRTYIHGHYSIFDQQTNFSLKIEIHILACEQM